MMVEGDNPCIPKYVVKKHSMASDTENGVSSEELDEQNLMFLVQTDWIF